MNRSSILRHAFPVFLLLLLQSSILTTAQDLPESSSVGNSTAAAEATAIETPAPIDQEAGGDDDFSLDLPMANDDETVPNGEINFGGGGNSNSAAEDNKDSNSPQNLAQEQAGNGQDSSKDNTSFGLTLGFVITTFLVILVYASLNLWLYPSAGKAWSYSAAEAVNNENAAAEEDGAEAGARDEEENEQDHRG